MVYGGCNPFCWKKWVRQLAWWLFPTDWKNNLHVPNQQPAYVVAWNITLKKNLWKSGITDSKHLTHHPKSGSPQIGWNLKHPETHIWPATTRGQPGDPQMNSWVMRDLHSVIGDLPACHVWLLEDTMVTMSQYNLAVKPKEWYLHSLTFVASEACA